jgi:hypothetical protein
MNIEQLVNMVMRIFLRRAVGKGIDAGIRAATGGRAEDGYQPRNKRQQARAAKQAARMARRLGKF